MVKEKIEERVEEREKEIVIAQDRGYITKSNIQLHPK